MAHTHNVYDADPHFSIDPISRKIKNESSKKVILIQGDHKSERFSFDMPREIEGHDMTKCDRVEVHYLNIENGTKNESAGLYDVDDMQIHPDDSEKVVFTWLLTSEATKYVGSLSFLIRFCCIGTDNVAEYVWHTAINTEFGISNGMNNAETVAETFPDIIAQWEEKIFGDAGTDTVVVDSELDENSENPVQNRAIVNAFKEIKYNFDVIHDIDKQTNSGVFIVRGLSSETKLLFVTTKSTSDSIDTDVTQVLVDTSGYRKWRTKYFNDDGTWAWSKWKDEANIIENLPEKWQLLRSGWDAYSPTYTIDDVGYYTGEIPVIIVGHETYDGKYTALTRIRFELDGTRSISSWDSESGNESYSEWENESDILYKRLSLIFATKEEIGNIETSLENIIAKYGLGTDTIAAVNEIIDEQNEILGVTE